MDKWLKKNETKKERRKERKTSKPEMHTSIPPGTVTRGNSLGRELVEKTSDSTKSSVRKKSRSDSVNFQK